MRRQAGRLSKLGDGIVAAVRAVAVLLQEAGYTNRAHFTLSKEALGDLQLNLRRIARVVPLDCVLASATLKALVFFDAPPWCFFSLDRLDRCGEEWRALGSVDPMQGDDDDNAELDEHMGEYMARSGGRGMSMSKLQMVMEMMRGKGADSELRDMTPHHIFGPFSCTLLLRLVLAARSSGDHERYFHRDVCARIVEVSIDQHGLGQHAGGEFCGFALSVASGVGKFGGVGKDASYRSWFLGAEGPPMAMVAMASEIVQGGDSHCYIQRTLANVPLLAFAQKQINERICMLSSYCLASLDGAVMCYGAGPLRLSESKLRGRDDDSEDDESVSYEVEDIQKRMQDAKVPDNTCDLRALVAVLSNVLDASPCLVPFLTHGVENQDALAHSFPRAITASGRLGESFRALAAEIGAHTIMLHQSTFGNFLVARFAVTVQRLQRKAAAKTAQPSDPALPPPPVKTARVVTWIVKRWIALPEAEKAGYRWSTFSKEKQERLKETRLNAPVGRMSTEYARMAGAAKSLGTSDRAAAIAIARPSCAHCGKESGPGLVLLACGGCKLARYCEGTECQKADWATHKKACRAAKKKAKAQSST